MAQPNGKPTKRRKDGVAWSEETDGYVPHYRWRGFKFKGVARPYPKFLEGEMKMVYTYLLSLAAKDLFGESPVNATVSEGMIDFECNEAFDEIPFLFSNEDDVWEMSDGSSVFSVIELE